MLRRGHGWVHRTRPPSRGPTPHPPLCVRLGRGRLRDSPAWVWATSHHAHSSRSEPVVPRRVRVGVRPSGIDGVLSCSLAPKPSRGTNVPLPFATRFARSLITSFGDRPVGRAKLDICRARRELSGAASTVSCGPRGRRWRVGLGGKTSPALMVPTCILTSPCWCSRPCGRLQPLSRCERDQRR